MAMVSLIPYFIFQSNTLKKTVDMSMTGNIFTIVRIYQSLNIFTRLCQKRCKPTVWKSDTALFDSDKLLLLNPAIDFNL